mmetsp:Transcript_29119/g.33292  ORF Transcript_29119/g.33292 Transcript_29119/m.33292 type:complete len:207 (+) Transcript_29119:30-650(+)
MKANTLELEILNLSLIQANIESVLPKNESKLQIEIYVGAARYESDLFHYDDGESLNYLFELTTFPTNKIDIWIKARNKNQTESQVGIAEISPETLKEIGIEETTECLSLELHNIPSGELNVRYKFLPDEHEGVENEISDDESALMPKEDSQHHGHGQIEDEDKDEEQHASKNDQLDEPGHYHSRVTLTNKDYTKKAILVDSKSQKQ